MPSIIGYARIPSVVVRRLHYPPQRCGLEERSITCVAFRPFWHFLRVRWRLIHERSWVFSVTPPAHGCQVLVLEWLCHTIAPGMPSAVPRARTSSLKSVFKGSISSNCISSGSPHVKETWWFALSSFQIQRCLCRAFCEGKSTSGSFGCSSSNTYTNLFPMIFRFVLVAHAF